MEKEQSGFLKFIKFIFDENNHGTEEKATDNVWDTPDLLNDDINVYYAKKRFKDDDY